MHYYGKATKAKILMHRFTKMRDIDRIPEEVFCKVLDMLNTGGYNIENNVMGYTVEVSIRMEDDRGYFQNINISNDRDGGYVYLLLGMHWDNWFRYKAAYPSKGDMQSFIDEKLIELSDTMEWPK